MQVYLAWSGERSRLIAEAFKQFLPTVIQTIEPFFSPSDIEKGARWQAELSGRLEECNFGLIFLVPENIESRWLNFEAGALSKVETSRVVCVKFEEPDVKQPLSQFQHVEFTKEDVRRLVMDMFARTGVQTPHVSAIERAFEMFWPGLEAEINGVLKHRPNEKVTKATFSQEETLKQILELSSLTSRRFSELTASLAQREERPIASAPPTFALPSISGRPLPYKKATTPVASVCIWLPAGGGLYFGDGDVVHDGRSASVDLTFDDDASLQVFGRHAADLTVSFRLPPLDEPRYFPVIHLTTLTRLSEGWRCRVGFLTIEIVGFKEAYDQEAF